jgi:hypothetical protein
VTFRFAQIANGSAGNKISLTLPHYSTLPRPYQEKELWAMERFEWAGILLPRPHWRGMYMLLAQCPSDADATRRDGYCSEQVQSNYDPDVCPLGYIQVAYDKCCKSKNDCVTP